MSDYGSDNFVRSPSPAVVEAKDEGGGPDFLERAACAAVYLLTINLPLVAAFIVCVASFRKKRWFVSIHAAAAFDIQLMAIFLVAIQLATEGAWGKESGVAGIISLAIVIVVPAAVLVGVGQALGGQAPRILAVPVLSRVVRQRASSGG